MMENAIKDNKLFYTVLKLLEPIGHIDCEILKRDLIFIKKDNIVFCIIIDMDIYLRSNRVNEYFFLEEYIYSGQKFKKLKKNYLNNGDSFLRIATEAYWLAAGMKEDMTS